MWLKLSFCQYTFKKVNHVFGQIQKMANVLMDKNSKLIATGTY